MTTMDFLIIASLALFVFIIYLHTRPSKGYMSLESTETETQDHPWDYDPSKQPHDHRQIYLAEMGYLGVLSNREITFRWQIERGRWHKGTIFKP